MPNARPFTPEQQSAELAAYLAWLSHLSDESSRVLFPARSRWFRSEVLSLYTRLGLSIVGGQQVRVLCLASIELVPECRSQGFFENLLRTLLEKKDTFRIQALTAESVQPKRLADFLIKQGFVHYQGYAGTHVGNYVLWLDEKLPRPTFKPLPRI